MFVAPRGVGKSTWNFLLLPTWALAHEHIVFVAAFSDSATQAEDHLATFKRELGTNQRLQEDFPTLCKPGTKGYRGQVIADNRSQYVAESGAIFMARGIDSSNLGMKVGSKRPELLLLDDVEPGESNYSPHLAKKRLATIIDDVFPMNHFGRVVIVGTTTMPGSIIHQFVQAKDFTDEEYELEDNTDLRWIKDEHFKVHHYPALYESEGEEVSLWPEKWPLETLQAMRHTRSFQKNYMNEPMNENGEYWQPEDIVYLGVDNVDVIKTIVFVDPAVTSTTKSDETGFAVISLIEVDEQKKLLIRHAEGKRYSPKQIADRTKALVERFEAGTVLLEKNQGGDMWNTIMAEIPVPVRLVHSSKSKDYRVAQGYALYEQGRVAHSDHFLSLETQQFNYPNVRNDDVIDAVCTGLICFVSGMKGNNKSKTLPYA